MWELDPKEAWALKNDAFKWWCWRRFLRVPWTARRSNQLVLKEINPEYSLKGLMLKLKLKLQYSGHLMQRANSLEKTLMVGKIEGRRKRGWQRMRWLECITNSTGMHLNKLWATVEDRGACSAAVHGVAKSWTWPNDWTTIPVRVIILDRCSELCVWLLLGEPCEGGIWAESRPSDKMPLPLFDQWDH